MLFRSTHFFYSYNFDIFVYPCRVNFFVCVVFFYRVLVIFSCRVQFVFVSSLASVDFSHPLIDGVFDILGSSVLENLMHFYESNSYELQSVFYLRVLFYGLCFFGFFSCFPYEENAI